MGLGKKCDDRASGRLDCDLTCKGGRDTLCMGERKVRRGNGLREMRGDGKRTTRRVMLLKDIKMRKIVRGN